MISLRGWGGGGVITTAEGPSLPWVLFHQDCLWRSLVLDVLSETDLLQRDASKMNFSKTLMKQDGLSTTPGVLCWMMFISLSCMNNVSFTLTRACRCCFITESTLTYKLYQKKTKYPIHLKNVSVTTVISVLSERDVVSTEWEGYNQGRMSSYCEWAWTILRSVSRSNGGRDWWEL